ncbi:MAG: DUF1598 domain-containing protein [Pirellulales bacterium]|nr:DUF1598 domain-containing protein [Pirellulales bacterium]
MRLLRVVVWSALVVGLTLCGVSTATAQQLAGVHIDADGVLRMRVIDDPGGQLMRERLAAAQAALNPEVAVASPLRKISLTRLERAVADRLAKGLRLGDEMRYLAGITRLQYVFYYPESRDIVVAGPAGGWAEDLTGRVCSIETGRPVLQLEDLVVAMRAYPPGEKGGPTIGCSIDPTPEGLAKMQEFLRQVGPHATPADTDTIVNGLRTSMGMQKVSVLGVSPRTHFAQVLVEADYRMKLIGIGLERPPIKMTSYVDRASPAGVARNALQRWFFVPDYQCVRVAGEKLAMELVGDGVKLVGEGEVVNAAGGRVVSAGQDRASQIFVTAFTKKYPQLAEKSPIYAQLRDLIDMSIAAAFIQEQDYYTTAGWRMEFFGDEKKFATETCQAPEQVETAVTSIWKGTQLMTPLGGGVTVNAERALEQSNLLPDDENRVQSTRSALKVDLADGQWWWD